VKRTFGGLSSIGLIAFALLGSVPAWAAELKIGFVDFQKLATESPQAKALQDGLKAEFLPRQNDLQRQEQSLKSRQDKLQKDAATMTEDQRAHAQQELETAGRDWQRKANEFRDDVQARQNQEFSRLQKVLVEEVRAYAKAQNFDLIVSDAAVVYGTSSLDVTPAILTSLQAHTGKAGTGSPPAPKPPGSGH
jgi:outer membrane protein